MNIHYFQRYSQKENVVTNNTLLLLSRLYQHSPLKFQAFLNELLGDIQVEIGSRFSQQVKGLSSVPDGIINQSSFKILVETKLHEGFNQKQLKDHLDSFEEEEMKFLLSLSPREPSGELIDAIDSYIKKSKKPILYVSTTFSKIIQVFQSVIDDRDYELEEMINDFADFASNSALIPQDEFRMRVVTCGLTLNENFKYNVYYDPADRGYSPHSYMGIYHRKSVKGVGKILNIITADLDMNENLIIYSTTNGEPTEEMKSNIIQAIKTAMKVRNWNISRFHKFYCVDQFFPIDFRKSSKYPLQGTKYFNFLERFPNGILSTSDLAKFLDGKTWENH